MISAAKEVETCAFPMMASVIKSEKCKLIPKHLLLNTIKGRTFQELGKQTMSSANFQAEQFLSGLVFDSSTFLLSLKIDQNSKFVYRALEKCAL